MAMNLVEKQKTPVNVTSFRKRGTPGYALLLLVFCFARVLSPDAGGYSTQTRLSNLTVQEGLSQSSILCILQDAKGFLWFGTQDGLNRYNGYDFETYTHNPQDPDSLLNNYIYAIYESPGQPGVIWLGTNRGLCAFHSGTERFISPRNAPLPFKKMPETAVNHIVEGPGGALWLGTLGEGVIRFNREKGVTDQIKNTLQTPDKIADNSITALAADMEDNLWIGSYTGGLCKLNMVTEESVIYTKSPGGLMGGGVLALFRDHMGRIWIGNEGGGLSRYHRDHLGREIFVHHTNTASQQVLVDMTFISTISQSRENFLWIGTRGDGLYMFFPETGEFRPYPGGEEQRRPLKYHEIRSIYGDRAGSLWVGTFDKGVFKIDPMAHAFSSHPAEAVNPAGRVTTKAFAFCECRSGGYWVGTDRGVFHFDAVSKSFQCLNYNTPRPKATLHNHILSIYEERDGSALWSGSFGGGLFRYDAARRELTHYTHEPANLSGISHNTIHFIVEDRDGRLWIGTNGGGLNVLPPNRDRHTPFRHYRKEPGNPESLVDDEVYALHQDQNGTIWFATWGGISKFNPQTATFRNFSHTPGCTNCLQHNQVLCILRDSNGTLWAGTMAGLNSYDEAADRWNYYSTQTGLPNNVIYGILEESPVDEYAGGHLWMSTNRGLSRLNIVSGEFRNYDRHDGLQANEFNSNAYFKAKDGRMFFGGVGGFTVFQPRYIKENPHIPPVVLTDFQLFYKSVPIRPGGGSPLSRSISETEQITLPYNRNTFSFGFAALNYINPEKNRYAYKLEGFHDDWIVLKKKQVVPYTNVPPGDYLFRVKGSNDDGAWNEKGATVRIVIIPPFWRTWWFILLMVLLFFSLLTWLHKRRTHLLKERMDKDRLENELKLKADYTAMLVHDLRSPLTAIMGYSDLLSQMPERMDPKRTGTMISNTSNKMLRLINDMLDISKFEAGKMTLVKESAALVPIIRSTVDLMLPLLHRKQITVIWENSEAWQKRKLMIDPEKMEQVANNLLNNAIKFSPKDGNITIYFSEENGPDGHIEVGIIDEGPGVPEEKKKYLFDKYAQLNKTLNVKGTGLGLAVSRMIVEAHGGDIGYRPGDGEMGCTFYFSLPVNDS